VGLAEVLLEVEAHALREIRRRHLLADGGDQLLPQHGLDVVQGAEVLPTNVAAVLQGRDGDALCREPAMELPINRGLLDGAVLPLSTRTSSARSALVSAASSMALPAGRGASAKPAKASGRTAPGAAPAAPTSTASRSNGSTGTRTSLTEFVQSTPDQVTPPEILQVLAHRTRPCHEG